MHDQNKKKMLDISNHLKNFGFIFQGSEIYGGLANTWDYGPVGFLLKQKIEEFWRKFFILKQDNSVEIDSKILMNPNVWKASGHVSNFSDPLIENKVNGKRYRADKIIEENFPEVNVQSMSEKEIHAFIVEHVKEYENSKTSWSEIRKFQLMFQTSQGVVEDYKNLVYLRPETAQGIFINFKNILRSTRAKLPLAVGQVGKSFRNEVTPGNFIFRTREFEQMELEVFCLPEEAEEIYQKYINLCWEFLLELGINKNSIRKRIHQKEELAHYSKGTCDYEFNFPFGWGELLGIANRGDFDLKNHSHFSQEDLSYLNPLDNQRIIPYVIEPSIGLDRLMLALLCDAYHEESVENETRVVLKLDKKIAPYRFAVLPLVKKLSEKAKELYKNLVDLNLMVSYDESGSIGKRYRRQDAIGTYECITIDYQSLEDDSFTIRNRDSMEQKRLSFEELKGLL
ncbi:glycine--tRNA ligase [Mycoplasmopsis pulmonis]|uniref:glycine--tRNA ligase n=1 Tax=Mycoplasmopsis pulmonis TaxID=2107 RepID=UPI001004E775|nr:glycine--tRNA ligase [Mycoplasmopsis pulmonis]VEU68216.1 Glycine--tRNA ligase [Mycoplasmopsis pulmonis]